jgi:hypothetical protein
MVTRTESRFNLDSCSQYYFRTLHTQLTNATVLMHVYKSDSTFRHSMHPDTDTRFEPISRQFFIGVRTRAKAKPGQHQPIGTGVRVLREATGCFILIWFAFEPDSLTIQVSSITHTRGGFLHRSRSGSSAGGDDSVVLEGVSTTSTIPLPVQVATRYLRGVPLHGSDA